MKNLYCNNSHYTGRRSSQPRIAMEIFPLLNAFIFVPLSLSLAAALGPHL